MIFQLEYNKFTFYANACKIQGFFPLGYLITLDCDSSLFVCITQLLLNILPFFLSIHLFIYLLMFIFFDLSSLCHSFTWHHHHKIAVLLYSGFMNNSNTNTPYNKIQYNKNNNLSITVYFIKCLYMIKGHNVLATKESLSSCLKIST